MDAMSAALTSAYHSAGSVTRRMSASVLRLEPTGGPETLENRFLNRELSWLDFNERVLALAEERSLALLERVKFAAIFAANLDEFYQVRVATLRSQLLAAPAMRSADGLAAAEQLELIAERAFQLAGHHARVFSRQLCPRLASAGIRILRWGQLDDEARRSLAKSFVERVFPELTPLAVDPGHPFPYISNLSLNLAVSLREPGDRETLFARIKVPPTFPRFWPVGVHGSFVPFEELIAANLGMLFPGMEILSHHPFRVTRASDLDFDDDGPDDLLRALEAELSRRRFSPTVRLEVDRRMPARIVKRLTREPQRPREALDVTLDKLELAALWSLVDLRRPDLHERPFQPVTPPALAHAAAGGTDLFATIDDHDVLVHHPYDSFTDTVQALIEQAAADPDVLAIKQTLYRTSGESPIVDALIEAAAAGKQVVVLVEIKARFDEKANIAWARTLERAGCHVVYGLIGLKTHCKLAMVVRREGEAVRRYVHIGTGNYHPTTANHYEDVGLLTSDPILAADVSNLFNLLSGYSLQDTYESLIVAPLGMRRRMIEMIGDQAVRAEGGQPAGIVMKLNNLVDEAIIDALYDAARRGVEIDLIVRSICALRPAVRGLSERIRVRSILGRFLEHSRIYRFGAGEDDQFWIGSADMMHRNLDRRVEALVRVETAAHKARLRRILELAVADTTAWQLAADGSWSRVNAGAGPPISLQVSLMRAAYAGAVGRT